MPLITSAEVTDALVQKLRDAGVSVDPATVTAAEVLALLENVRIVNPVRQFRSSTTIHRGNMVTRNIFTSDPNVFMTVTAEAKHETSLHSMAHFVMAACNAGLLHWIAR